MSTPFALLQSLTERLVALQDPRDLRLVLASITRELAEAADLLQTAIWLVTTDDKCPVCIEKGQTGLDGGKPGIHVAAEHGRWDSDAGKRFHLVLPGRGLPGRVLIARQPMLIRNVSEVAARYLADRDSVPQLKGGTETDEEIQWAINMGIRSGAAWPLIVQGDRLIGVLGSLARRDISEEEFQHIGVLARQAASAIHAAYLFEENRRLRERLEVENAYLKEEIRTEQGFDEIVGESRALRTVLKDVKQVAATDSTVLLLGETGTGKELMARAIHNLSPRRERPLIKVNCGGIAPGLVDSELFGHERGAFTGALQRRIGRFELADRGTLFLDEIGELPAESQTRMLRVLQEQEFERVGGSQPIRVDVRLIAATNRDLEAEVGAGRFRADLYYRLNVFPARIPPLRERTDDIPRLVNHFVAHQRRRLAKPLEGVSQAGMDRLMRYSWPGNVRELQNVMERACVLARGPLVEIADDLAATATPAGTDRVLTMVEMEKQHIARALDAAGGTIGGPKGAAKVLGMNPNTLRSRMEKLGML